jgi:5'(3')-deoxyribonucleotidase
MAGEIASPCGEKSPRYQVAGRKRIWVDVDEVLADFQSGVFGIVAHAFGRSMSAEAFTGDEWDMFKGFDPEELKLVLKECERPGFCAGLAIVPGAIEGLAKLRTIADVYAVTSHFHSQTWVFERDWWLQRYMAFERGNIVHTSAKHLITADACLDDKPANVLNWKAAHPHGLAMLWSIPNTRKIPNLEAYRVHDWNEVYDRVANYEVA